MRIIIFALTLAASGAAGAQGIYRCGTTFSETPCGPGSITIQPAAATTSPQAALPPLPDTTASPETVSAAKAACVAALIANLKDPDSLKLGTVERRGPWYAYVGDQRVPARAYSVNANAKNTYGGYTGEKAYLCSVDLATERTVLAISGGM